MINYSPLNLFHPFEALCDSCDPANLQPKEMSEIKKTIQDMPQPLNVYIAGGEPLRYPRFFEILNCLFIEGVQRIRLKTTGTALRQPGMIEKLARNGILQYELECLGGAPSLHDNITGVTHSFRDLKKSVEALTHFRIKTHPVIHHPFIVLTVPVCSDNTFNLQEITRLLLRWRPDRIRFYNTGTCHLSQAIEHLQICCRMAAIEQVWPVISGFPFCVSQGLEPYMQELYDRQALYEINELCDNCIFKEICCGIKSSYLEHFGPAGLNAVKWHANQSEILRLASAGTMTAFLTKE